MAVIGYYHSHPSGNSAPSPADAARADAQGRCWLILTPAAAAIWVSRRGGAVLGAFEPVELEPL